MKRSIQLTAVIGALLLAILLAGLALWVTGGAAVSTEQAVDRLSDFYLQELAGRRSQVVSSMIDTNIEQMQRAMNAVTEDDLASEASLRSFIGKIETLYDLDLFAVVDEADVVYCRYATYMGGSRYDFLSMDLSRSGPVISTVHQYGGTKKICIVIPLSGLTFMDRELKACFVQTDIEELAEMLAFDNDQNETWFGMYYRNGENLTHLDFGPVGKGQNLLEIAKEVIPEDEWTVLNENFRNGMQGFIEISFDADKHIMYYTPIRDTGWMMTVLISERLIQDQVRGISDELIRRTTIQFIISGLALTLYFLSLLLESRRESRILLEKEKEHSKASRERARRSESELGVMKGIANKDPLTGVQSKYAYTEKVKELDQMILSGDDVSFAVVIGDLNGLKRINDTFGHAAGDEYLKEAAAVLCEIYEHSPVYRVGGDEFAAVLQGVDYRNRSVLLERLNTQIEENARNGRAVIATGMAERLPEDQNVLAVFDRADRLMYERKQELKASHV